MRVTALTLLCLLAGLTIKAQPITLNDVGKVQYNLNRRGLPHGNYSGITMIDDTTFAVVSDKDQTEGFHLWNIEWEGHKPGRVTDRFMSSLNSSSRDAEGIAYRPSTRTVFISAESDQRIKEYRLDGSPTGREMNVPMKFGTDSIRPNGGFESLTYDGTRGLFWTCTELPLKKNTDEIWLQSFGEDLMPQKSILYRLDPDKDGKWRTYVHGIAELCALNDGRLLVLERTVAIKSRYWGSYCEVKIYSVFPSGKETEVKKTLVKSFRTCLNLRNWLGKVRFANYEGMCVRPTDNGKDMLLLINDSQNGIKGLNDYIKIFEYAN